MCDSDGALSFASVLGLELVSSPIYTPSLHLVIRFSMSIILFVHSSTRREIVLSNSSM